MKRYWGSVAVAVLIVVAGLFLPAAEARGRHNPPPISVPAPPPFVLIPGTYAYFVLDINADVVFYQGGWYRSYRGNWFRSDRLNGRWSPVPPPQFPPVLRNLPPNWKQVPPGQPRLPHEQVLRSWQQWERERRWDRPQPAPQPAPQPKPQPAPQPKPQPAPQPKPQPEQRYEQPREPRPGDRYEERREPRPEDRYEERREPRPDRAPDDEYRDQGPGGDRR